MWYDTEHPINNLPDAYKKTPESNNYKILETERYINEILRDDLRLIDEMLDITKASGKTLDLYGERVGQKRGAATDEQYRILILAKIARNLSNGTHESVVNCMCLTFSCEPSEVWFVDEDKKTCTVSIKQLPIEKIEQAGFTQKQALAIIKALIPVSVTLEDYYVESTFEFSAGEDDMYKEENEEKGFSGERKLSDGTTKTIYGGYFGYYFASDNEPTLPI